MILANILVTVFLLRNVDGLVGNKSTVRTMHRAVVSKRQALSLLQQHVNPNIPSSDTYSTCRSCSSIGHDNRRTTMTMKQNIPYPSFTLEAVQEKIIHRPSNLRNRVSGWPLGMASSSNVSSDIPQQEVDTEAIVKYVIALVTQMSLIAGFFYTLDTILPMAIGTNTLPTAATWIMCYLFSLKSRVFNPLNNDRPDRQKAIKEGKSDGFRDRNQPSWTPPGVVFPIMWLLIIGPLRATSSTLIVNSLGGYLTLPLMSLMLHLSCGDIWNTINNTEKRYGTSIVGIVAVYVSALHAAWRYYQVEPLAGQLLGATAIWLTIAGTLIFEIWRLNPNERTGKRESLMPMKDMGEESVTQFAWGKGKDRS